MSLSDLLFKLQTPRSCWHHCEYQPHMRIHREHSLRQDQVVSGQVTLSYKQGSRVQTLPLEQLRPHFEGKTTYLVGTGPSINEQNLQKLRDHSCLFLNGAITLIKKHAIYPAAYMVVDKGFIKRHPHFVPLIPKQVPCIFTLGVVKQILEFDKNFFDDRPLYLVEKATKPYERPALSMDQLDKKWFYKDGNSVCSLDIRYGFAEAGTVMYVAAQLMLFASVRRIILVGFDLGNADQPRFYETNIDQDKSGLKSALQDRIIPHFKLLNKLCLEQGISLCNASHLSSMPYEIIPFNPCLMPAAYMSHLSKSQPLKLTAAVSYEKEV